MSMFKNRNFVNEFAYRTKLNYYNARLLSSEPDAVDDIQSKINHLKAEMGKNGYEISDFYEVTQLINSLIGLLVFPEQAYFNEMTNNPNDLKRKFPTLSTVVESEGYINTYKENYGKREWDANTQQVKSPKNLMLHMKNAVSHMHLMIHPENCRLLSGDKEQKITAIVFEDACPYYYNEHKGEWRSDINLSNFRRHKGSFENYRVNYPYQLAYFKLRIPVENLEAVLMEICDYFTKVG